MTGSHGPGMWRSGSTCGAGAIRTGAFEPYRNDGVDGFDVIGWAAEQSWCDGDVATWGGSYGGRIQWLAALQQPPALKAMIVEVAPSDPFVEDPTGVPAPMRINWHRLTDGRMPQYTETVDWMEVYAPPAAA